jgi:outer membrane protein assembly factor BamE (lipoprotein component of BamABCDE complex)
LFSSSQKERTVASCNSSRPVRPGITGTSRALLALPVLLLLAACQTTHPYKMELAQDNFINAGKILELKTGMTKAQVAAVLGTPLLAEHMQSEQWEYTYAAHQAGHPDTRTKLDLYFNGNSLARFDGQLPPGPGQVVAVAPGATLHARGHKYRHALHRHARSAHRHRRHRHIS